MGWVKPKLPPPKPFTRRKIKVHTALLREPKKPPPAEYFPSEKGRQRANSIRWIRSLMSDMKELFFSKKRIDNACRVCRTEWRKRQAAGMKDSPLYLPFRPVNGTSAHVTLPIERMNKLKSYNRTTFRAYVDDGVWRAKSWHFFDLGARFFLRKKSNKVELGSTFQFICGYPGAENFTYHAYDINPLSSGYPSFVKWTTGAIWNETGKLEIRGDEGAGSHVIFHGKDSAAAAGSGSGAVQMADAVDFAAHLMETVEPEDFVVVKIDVENAEFRVIDRLFSTGAIDLIDEMFIECHGKLTRQAYKLAGIKGWVPEAWVRSIACINIETRLRRHGVYLHEWD
eukprot:TRINITY_DN15805_c0_g2_i1.p1 TRINITY_DN15805_c0_g2~~TRINITY_DN15805_c0_g2_i1.p1  ORF type:complete len:383 (+),score=128.74 TRINITY_DN15805_c0_g2_i1:130-1149(+)